MVRRIFVEKKEAFAVRAKELQEEIKSYLGIQTVTGVRVLIRYDVENITEETFEKACCTEKASGLQNMRLYSVWNISRGSLTRERILPYSVYSF